MILLLSKIIAGCCLPACLPVNAVGGKLVVVVVFVTAIAVKIAAALAAVAVVNEDCKKFILKFSTFFEAADFFFFFSRFVAHVVCFVAKAATFVLQLVVVVVCNFFTT